MTVAMLALMAEICTLTATFMIRYLANYLMDDEANQNDALIYLAIFTSCVLMSVLIRNFYIYYGYFMSLEIRKTLITAMYDKVAALSMRSLTETNSGKLITLVSSDIFTLERPLSMAPFGLAAPIINIFCYLLIWYVAGWPYAIIVGGIWVVTYLLQMCTANL
jgi:ABC-type multidrug transport system fused ATPase/permease subunit